MYDCLCGHLHVVIIAVDGLLGRRVLKKAKVMHEYKAEQADELSLEVGQIIEILKQVCYCARFATCSRLIVFHQFMRS